MLHPQSSLSRQTLIKMGILIGIVIILMTLLSYWHVVSILKSQTVAQLEKYITERGQRESSVFRLAQDNHIILKKELYQRLEELGSQDPREQFEQLFVEWTDGTTRNRPKDQNPKSFDTTKYPSVFISPQVELNADIRRRVITFYKLLTAYGPAWANRFADTYINTPENIVTNYWPGEPRALRADADLNILNEEYFYVSDKKHNPERKQAWTGLYFDHVVKLWMVSLETPIDDVQGKHIATLGHDIILNELMERTIHDTLEGTYNLILRPDGRLIAHPDKITEIQDKGGYFDILKSGEPHLSHIFELVKNIKPGQVVIENTQQEEYLAITKIDGPDWYLVTVYPKSLLSARAIQTAYVILFLGILSLIIEIIVLFLVLHREIAKPLRDFIFATQKIAYGNFNLLTQDQYGTVILPVERSDELGQLAHSFNRMAEQLKTLFDKLESKNKEFQVVIKDIVQVSHGLAQGNLRVTPQAKYKGELSKIKEALETALYNQHKVIKDIVQLSQGLAEGRKQVMPKIKYRGDFVQVKNALEVAAKKLAVASKKNAIQDWFKTGQAQLNEQMSGEVVLSKLAKKIITCLTTYIKGQVGLFYLLKEGTILQFIASYAYTANENIPNQFRIGEGLVGEAALANKMIARKQTSKEYSHIIQSGITTAVPQYVLIVPFLYEDEVKGVIEIGFSEETQTSIQQDFLQQVMPTIGIAINSAQSRARMQVLLEQSQKQTKQLQRQQEKLQQTNEELQNQSEELQVQTEELQSQQEELRQTNDELEERSKELERQKNETSQKNLALEQSQVEMEKAKAAIENKAKELGLASKYKSEFLANMSHELRTPLNSLLILAQLLSDNDEKNLTDKQAEYARTIYNAGSELLTLINEILDLSKVEAGKIEVQPEEVSLTELVETVEHKFRPVAENKGLAFHSQLEEWLPSVLYTDGQRLKQIINNLLSNAFKFTSEGEIRLTIQRPQEVDLGLEAAIAISVADTGIGIPKDKQQAVFEAFKQVDGSTSRHYGGTGLGLSISRQLARLLGGDLQLQSEEGKGTTFTLYLPEKFEFRPEEVEVPQEPITIISGETEATPRAATMVDDRDNLSPEDNVLLIIEDDSIFYSIISNLAREKHFKYLLAEDGKTGLQLAEQYRPHAIILDVGLPQLDGWSVMERLKDNPDTRHIPVHFISAYEQSQDAKQMGAIGYLHKPVNMEQLGEAFKKIKHFVAKTVKKLLIVVNKESQGQQIMDLVGGGDVETTIAQSKAQALQYLNKATFECIILGVDAEQRSAFQLLEQLYQDERLSQVPVIIYAEREFSLDEEALLQRVRKTLTVKEVRSPERLLDEATLFLHQMEAKLAPDKQQMLQHVHDKETIFKGKKILIVDDDVRNVFALVSVLEEKSIDVFIGENGAEALALLDKVADIDLVLMDIMMPEMDGYEAMRKIREQSRFRQLPIIALTAKAMKGDKAKCIDAGANDYLAKPVDKNKLLSLMRVWLYR
ncbi:MAG: response regulator [Pseudomonadota bacterium]